MMNLKLSTVVFGTQVIDTRDGKPWTITGKNSKTKTLVLTDAENKERPFALNTVNKNFEEVVIETVETVTEETAEETEIAGAVVTPVTEAEPTQKPKKERKPRQKKDNPERDKYIAAFEGLIAAFEYVKTTYEKVGPNFVVLRTEEKSKVKYEFYLGRNDVRINMKPVDAEALGLDFTEIQKYYLPAVVRFRYSDEAIKTTKAILAK